METVWICEEHYRELYLKLGGNVITMPIYNILRDKCEVENCSETADHMIYESDMKKL